MSFDRRWLEEVGSEDCQGHALWALGLCVSQAGQGSFQMLAAQLFEQALPVAAEFTSPRAWAFTLIGIDEYLRRFSGDRRANQIRESLTTKLMQRYADAATDDWQWFEEVVSYANAKLPHAMILNGRCMNNATMLELGLKTLRWLIKIQTSDAGAFRPIGSNGFYPRGQERAHLRPATHRSAGHDFRLHRSVSRDGRHVLGRRKRAARSSGFSVGTIWAWRSTIRPPAAAATACTWIGLSQNQGAESTLAFLLSLAEMQALQNTLTSFKEPVRRISRLIRQMNS